MPDAGYVFTHDRAHQDLDKAACRELLASQRLGRVALSVAALPSVVPVLYGLVGERVVFGVEDDPLYRSLLDNIVAFEVDHIDDQTNEGWTVLLVGRCRAALDLSSAGFTLPPFERPGAPVFPPADRLIGIALDRLSGQRTLDSLTRSL